MSIMSKLWRGRRTPPQMQWSDWFNVGEKVRDQDGDAIRRWIRSRYDHAAQLQHEENRYEVLRDGLVVETEHHARSPGVRGDGVRPEPAGPGGGWCTCAASVNPAAGADEQPASKVRPPAVSRTRRVTTARIPSDDTFSAPTQYATCEPSGENFGFKPSRTRSLDSPPKAGVS